jgi:hypothetical protein
MILCVSGCIPEEDPGSHLISSTIKRVFSGSRPGRNITSEWLAANFFPALEGVSHLILHDEKEITYDDAPA